MAKKSKSNPPAQKAAKPRAQKAIVVAAQGSGKNFKASSSRPIAGAGVLAKYLCAINDPFCMAAEGARIPDQYAMPTEALTARVRFTWSPISGAVETIVFSPDPRLSAVVFTGAGSVAPNLNVTGAGVLTTTPLGIVAGRASSLNYLSAVTCTALESRATKFRLVGWGLRIRNVTAASSVAGDLVVAITPCGTHIPATLGSTLGITSVSEPLLAGGWNEPQECFGIPYSSGNPSASVTANQPIVSSLETLPLSEVVSAAELAQTGGICVKPRISSAEAYSWRSPSLVNNAFGLGYSTAAAQGGSGTGFAYVNPSIVHIGGQNAISVQASGSSQVYEFEVVYHLEVQPNTIAGAGGLGHCASASPVLTSASLETAVARANASPFLEFVKHEGSRAFGSVVQALPGLMTKAAMMALGA